MPEINMLLEIESVFKDLSNAESRVAETILADPDFVMNSSISVVARRAKVSDPTVNRFCAKMGCSGFPQMKLILAQSKSVGTPFVSQFVSSGDSAQQYSEKIINGNANALLSISKKLQYSVIEKAVDVLAQTRRIVFFGIGGSGIVARDAQHKFLRLDVSCEAYSDQALQLMIAASIQPRDVLVAISLTGMSTSILENTQLAGESGATTIALTPSKSPLSKASTITIAITPKEDVSVYTPMTSRIIQLTIIDILATGVALRRGPSFVSHLEKIKTELRRSRLLPS